MALEDELLGQRHERAGQIRELGYQPYGHPFAHTHTISEVLGTYGSKTPEELADRIQVRIAGRIQTIRRMGKAGFINLIQAGEKLQLYVKKDAVSETNYKLYELLDIGDIIGAAGYLFRTKPANSRCTWKSYSSCRRSCLRFPRSGTALKTSKFGIASDISISSQIPKCGRSL